MRSEGFNGAVYPWWIFGMTLQPMLEWVDQGVEINVTLLYLYLIQSM